MSTCPLPNSLSLARASVIPILPRSGTVAVVTRKRSLPLSGDPPATRFKVSESCPVELPRCLPRVRPLPPSLPPSCPSSRETKLALERARLAALPNRIASGGPSKLEVEAVCSSTQIEYSQRLQRFEVFCEGLGVTVDALISEATLERALLEYFDQEFVNGGAVEIGTKLLAAIGHRWPLWHRSAQTGRLPRVRRALQGWCRLVPGGWCQIDGLGLIITLFFQR